MTTLYSAVGEELTHYTVDPDGGALSRQASVTLPADVQYAWPHPSGEQLYVVSSNGGPFATGDRHYVSAFGIDATGALHVHGAPKALPSRPLHISLDASGSFALITYNVPGRVTVHAIGADGAVGAEVGQPAGLDVGIFPHQLRMMPSNRTAILVTRGNDAVGERSEDPGALKVFDVRDGILTNRASIAPAGGYGFGPRHLDFHPTRRWVYVSLERQNTLQMYRFTGDDLGPEPAFVKTTLVEPDNVRPWQMAGTIHVHPNGRIAYLANRAHFMVTLEGQRVFGGGENTIAVYALDRETGEPTMIQSVDAHGLGVRTFALDAGGRMLVAASLIPFHTREGGRVVAIPAGLSIFRVRGDGKLDFVRKYDVETDGKQHFWMGIVEA
jgi:6-phosphogluconolactonase (cycloisomerase 2 family)